MDHTLLLILIIVLVVLCGGWYGRGRWRGFQWSSTASARSSREGCSKHVSLPTRLSAAQMSSSFLRYPLEFQTEALPIIPASFGKLPCSVTFRSCRDHISSIV